MSNTRLELSIEPAPCQIQGKNYPVNPSHVEYKVRTINPLYVKYKVRAIQSTHYIDKININLKDSLHVKCKVLINLEVNHLYNKYQFVFNRLTLIANILLEST